MNRLGSLLLAVALLLGVVWAARRSRAASATVDERWASVHSTALQRILGLAPSTRVEFKETRPSSDPSYFQVRLELVNEAGRQPLELLVSRDGQRVFHGRSYDLADPFREIRAQIRLEDAPARGPAAAPLTIVEYGDYTCGYCRQFYLTLEQALLDRYGDRLRLVEKNFPLTSLRAWSKDAALAAVCAHRQGNDKFWAMHEQLFGNSPRLKEGRTLLRSLARDAGLDVATFSTCLDQPEILAAVDRDLREGESVGVQGTPTFFLNGRPVPGLLPPSTFFRVVDEELAAESR